MRSYDSCYYCCCWNVADDLPTSPRGKSKPANLAEWKPEKCGGMKIKLLRHKKQKIGQMENGKNVGVKIKLRWHKKQNVTNFRLYLKNFVLESLLI